ENTNQQVKNDSSTGMIDLTKNDGKSKESSDKQDDKEDDGSEKSLKIDEDREEKPAKQMPEINETTIRTTKRPANLFNCLPKKPCQLTCSNLVSPETPRSEKTFVQCNLNGKLYTYLKPKRSTRVT